MVLHEPSRVIHVWGCGECPYNSGWESAKGENSDPNYIPVEEDYCTVNLEHFLRGKRKVRVPTEYTELYLETLVCAYHRKVYGPSELYNGGGDFPIGNFVRYRYRQSVRDRDDPTLLDVPIPDWCPLNDGREEGYGITREA